ncbi:MAG: hypothetical protein R3B35_04915 [Gemmatimonadales bacterium]
MYLLRRNSAAVLAAFAFVLGACSSESAPTESQVPTTGDLGEDPLRITLNPGSLVFQSNTATAPAPQNAGIGGLVAIGSGVQFGNIMYANPGVTPWATVDPRPTFSRDPLEWRHMVSINQAAFSALPNGAYSATVPVIVSAARNSPQMLNLFLCKGSGCLTLNSQADGSLSGTDATWDRTVGIDAPGGFYYDDYFLFVPAGATAYIRMLGSSCDPFTLGDTYFYVYDLDGNELERNDDGWCGLSSYDFVTNFSANAVVWRVRATSFGSGATGTYRIVVGSTAPVVLRDEASEVADREAKAAKAALTR